MFLVFKSVSVLFSPFCVKMIFNQSGHLMEKSYSFDLPYMSICNFVISHFGFEGGTLVPIVIVPCHCLLFKRGSAVAWWLMPRTPDPEVGGSSPTRVKLCCVLEQGTFTPW